MQQGAGIPALRPAAIAAMVEAPTRSLEMPPATDLADCTASELLQLYRSRQASPVEATHAVLKRIDALNPSSTRCARIREPE